VNALFALLYDFESVVSFLMDFQRENVFYNLLFFLLVEKKRERLDFGLGFLDCTRDEKRKFQLRMSGKGGE
jgi:hypothetical protein